MAPREWKAGPVLMQVEHVSEDMGVKRKMRTKLDRQANRSTGKSEQTQTETHRYTHTHTQFIFTDL